MNRWRITAGAALIALGACDVGSGYVDAYAAVMAVKR